MNNWIIIEAEHPECYEHVVCGPFSDAAVAVEHMQDSGQIQGFCEDDAIDCWTVTSDAEKDDVTRQWTEHGDNWGVYRPVLDSE
jgi:hypothetical protein